MKHYIIVFTYLLLQINILAEEKEVESDRSGLVFKLQSKILSGYASSEELQWHEFISDEFANKEIERLSREKSGLSVNGLRMKAIDGKINFYKKNNQLLSRLNPNDKSVLSEISSMMPEDVGGPHFAVKPDASSTNKWISVIGIVPWRIQEDYSGGNRNCDVIMEQVVKLKELKYLDLAYTHIDLKSIPIIKKIGTLKYFSVPQNIVDKQLVELLNDLPSIHFLVMESCGHVDGSFAIQSGADLREIAFRSTPIKKEYMADLIALENIECVVINDSYLFVAGDSLSSKLIRWKK